MVKRRNRKLETVIDRTLSNETTGVQYFRTPLRNALGYTDGFASSIWEMGTAVSFHNTGSETGGDFGELNKLNYDNLIELYTPDDRVYGISGTYVSSSAAQSGMLSGSSVSDYSFINHITNPNACGTQIEFSASFTGSFRGTVGGAWDTSAVLLENNEGYFEWQVSASVDSGALINKDNFWSVQAGIVPLGTKYAAYPAASPTSTPLSPAGPGTGSGPVGLERGTDFVTCVPGVEFPAPTLGVCSDLPATNNLFHIQFGDYAWYNYTTQNGEIGPKQYNVYASSSDLNLCLGYDAFGPNFCVYRGNNARWWNSPANELLTGVADYRWRIERKRSPTPIPTQNVAESIDWIFEFQLANNKAVPGEDGYCWFTYFTWPPMQADGTSSLYIDATMNPKLSQSLYFAADAWMFDRDSGNYQIPVSVLSASVMNYQTSSWTRSDYSLYPTASITYCYPAGFITNDSISSSTKLYNSRTPGGDASTRGHSYQNHNYKDYGLMWDVPSERARLIGTARYPAFNSYEDFSKDIRPMGKEYSIIPEFQISKLIDENSGDMRSVLVNYDFLTLAGGDITSSLAHAQTQKFNFAFIDNYCDSDFQSDLDLMMEKHESVDLAGPFPVQEVVVSCDAIMKLLPYEGFYPITRTAQIAALFSKSIDYQAQDEYNIELLKYNNSTNCWAAQSSDDYAASPNLHGIRTQGIMEPWFAPGMLYNSIKSGIAVGWTVATSPDLEDVYQMYNTGNPQDLNPNPLIDFDFTASWDAGTILNNEFLNTAVYHNPQQAKKLAFETLWQPSRIPSINSGFGGAGTDGAWHINYPETLSGYFTSSICTSSFARYTHSQNNNFMIRNKSLRGTVDSMAYKKAINNFMAETVRFFLRDRRFQNPTTVPDAVGQLTHFFSLSPDQILGGNRGIYVRPVEGGRYYMDVILKKDPGFVMCESGYPAVDGHRYFNQHESAIGIDDQTSQTFMNSAGTDLFYNLTEDDVIGSSPVYNFSASFDGRYFGPATQKYAAGWNFKNPVSGAHYMVCDPAQAPYTPPYFYGASVCAITYSCGDEWQNMQTFNWGKVFANLTFNFSNNDIEQKIREGNFNSTFTGLPNFGSGSFASVMAQNVGDSINLIGIHNLTEQEQTNPQQVRLPQSELGGTTYSRTENAEASRWTISTKWECPILNFNKQNTTLLDSGQYEFEGKTLAIPGGLHPTCSFSASGGFLNDTPIPLGRGMWSGYGLMDSQNEGVKFEIAQNKNYHDDGTITAPSQTGGSPIQYNNSIIDLMGFGDVRNQDISNTYIGRLGETRDIREAIVMIPYTAIFADSDDALNPESWAPTTSTTDRYYQAFPDRFFFKIAHDVVYGTTNIPKFSGEPGATDPEVTEVTRMLRGMIDFVFPPQFDWLRAPQLPQTLQPPTNFPPIVAYILPLNVPINRRDLQDIWQGVMPEAATSGSFQHYEESHLMGKHHFYGKGGGQSNVAETKIQPDIKFLVFRVKERAETQYNALTLDVSDDPGARQSFGAQLQSPWGAVHSVLKDFSYNWPYDFCSIVELAKLKTSFKIKK